MFKWLNSSSRSSLLWIVVLVPPSILLFYGHTNIHYEIILQPNEGSRHQPKNDHLYVISDVRKNVTLNDVIPGGPANQVASWENAGLNEFVNIDRNRSRQSSSPWWDGGQCIYDSGTDVWRPQFPSLEKTRLPKLKSGGTCGRRATSDGEHQRVISFCLFGDDPGYWTGLSETFTRIKTFYPGWKVYLYTNPRGKANVLCPLLAKHALLRVCDVTNLPYPLYNITRADPTMWRVAPLGDPKIDVLIVRDSDMMFTERDQSAVLDWLASGQMFHVMRDHPAHSTHILAGMWGARWDILPPKWASARPTNILPLPKPPSPKDLRKIRNKMLRMAAQHAGRGIDQHILKRELWPEMVGFLVSHDSFFCKTFSHGWRPWPTRRSHDEFVGNAYYRFLYANNTAVCPPECRPPEYPDWVSC